jgi:hypothetical protein
MEPYLQQQFELLLQDATGNFAERTVYRCGGPDAALERLGADPDGEGIHRAEFVLEALERRTLPPDPGGPVGEVLARLARAAFADVLTAMTKQLIQRQQIYS